MPKEFSRIDRVAELIQHELARLLRKEIQDPRLSLVTISAVEVSRDLAHAKIFVTRLKDEEQIEKTLRVLNKASGFLRHQLATNLNLRITPRLHFVHDESITYGNKMSNLINQAVVSDKKSSEE
jgi:ribosome-binding factor A